MNETELLQKIKDAEQQLADARRMLEDYKSKTPYRPNYAQKYYTVSSRGLTYDVKWTDDTVDEGTYSMGNVFRTKDDAEREVRRRKTHQKLKELAAKWNTEPISSNIEQEKYSLFYRLEGGLTMCNTKYSIAPNTIYFNKYVLQDILAEIPREELIEYCKGDY